MLKTCKYCNVCKDYKSVQSFAAHVSTCSKHPNILTLRATRGLSKRVPRIELTKKCPGCGIERNLKLTAREIETEDFPVYCTASCAGEHKVVSNSTREKIRTKLKGITYPNRIVSKESLLRGVENRKKTLDEQLLETPWELLSLSRRKRYVYLQQNGKCLLCGISDMWNNKPLTFQYDHIDGKNKTDYDNRRENVRMICPNCHTQTPTYGPKGMSDENREKARLSMHEARKSIKVT